ncbi:MAG: CDP-glycerol glycerophosphotransferase family protein [Propionibacteriaceae bacterium]|nr:CDP-glycerol glycerophosphotransferase family protein [Propionibacteriaceae bacterium]
MTRLKRSLIVVALSCAKGFARGLHGLMKLFPTRRKVVFISRQSDQVPLDFQLLIDSLQQKTPETSLVVLCRTLGHGPWAMVGYLPHFVRQVYHLATSRVAVLDSYSIAVGILRHQPELFIIQLWHGLGAFKKFGYSALDVAEGNTGRSSLDPRTLAQLMHQHENYDLVIASSERNVEYYAEAFNIDPEKLIVASLPRTDVLSDSTTMGEIRGRVELAHPQLVGKKNIIFAPTFRRTGSLDDQVRALANEVNYELYNLIVQVHPLTPLADPDPRTVVIGDFSTLEILSVCDAMITDYSAVAYEMYLLGKPVFFYQFDSEVYETDRGFYTHPRDFPGPRFTEASEVVAGIEANQYDLSAIESFIDSEIEHRTGNVDRLTSLIAEKLPTT